MHVTREMRRRCQPQLLSCALSLFPSCQSSGSCHGNQLNTCALDYWKRRRNLNSRCSHNGHFTFQSPFTSSVIPQRKRWSYYRS
jgi:hypothetical protein